jgi:acetyl-CoA/propionyl-CoA carboxylase biotin carboxyl carrier protein
MVVEVGGRRLEVTLPGGIATSSGGASAGAKKPRKATTKAKAAVSGDDVVAPMQGTIVKVAVADGDVVAAGDLVVVLEAMKMEQPLTAHKAGTISGVIAEVGTTVQSGTTLLQIKD